MALRRHEIAEYIVARDPAFAPVVATIGPPPARARVRVDDRFSQLARSITHQLLATKAAMTIHGRVLELVGGDVTPASVLALSVADLRAAGLSNTKAEAMIQLADYVNSGRVRIARHGYMDDADVVADVTQVRGIGPWTAHMYLMFTLARHDVWPTGDFGVRHGWSVIHELDENVSEAELTRLGEPFVGVRSAVADYCWAAVDEVSWL
ncbi:MAG: DNA-3-methyladenine glycosylase family protein [Acidimicrobiales bacterium]